MLREEGIIINPANAIEIEKTLERLNYEYNKEEGRSLADLKYYLSPLISRNKEDQEKVHKIFDKLDELAAANDSTKTRYIGFKEEVVSGEVEKDQPEPQQGTQKSLISRLWEKFFPALIVAAIILFILWKIFNPQYPGLTIQVNNTEDVINSPVYFTVALSDTTQKDRYTVDWKFPDTIIKNTFSVEHSFLSPGLQKVTAYLKNNSGKEVGSDSIMMNILCEFPPSVKIKRSADEETVSQSGKQVYAYEPVFINGSRDSIQYKYRWYVDDKFVSEKKILEGIRQFKSIRLVVNFGSGVHCSADSLIASINAVPAVNAFVSGASDYIRPPQITLTDNIIFSIALLLILALLPVYLLYKINTNIFDSEKEDKEKIKVKPKDGPYTIEFTKQDHLIGTEAEVEKLADLLRKRQISETLRLDIRRSIRSTVIAGGMPQLVYTPLTKPSNYLVFVDKEYPESHLVKLFEWLVAKWQNEQVDVAVYEYYKEPLYLSNKKLNQLRIPVERVAALYAGSTLFIFGDARHFVYPLKGKLKNWVSDKFNDWETKILVTPFAKNDWDKKELGLIQAGFFVVSSDISSRQVIEKVINRHIESNLQERHPVPATYTARFLNFSKYDTLKEYLADGNLLRWISSLAVFTSIDWNFTIAMGHAIEKDLEKKGEAVELVNYTNLLKLGRIEWMQNGLIPDSLKIKMLGQLDNDAELLARKTLLAQLSLIKKTTPITDTSLIKHEMDIHEKMNEFLIKSYNKEQVTGEDKIFVHNTVTKDQLDEAQEIYLKRGINTLLRNPFRQNRSIGLLQYFELAGFIDILFLFIAVVLSYVSINIGAFFINKHTHLFTWSYNPPSDLKFNISGMKDSTGYLQGAIRIGDSAKTFSPARDTVIDMKGIYIRDTSVLAHIVLTDSNDQKAADVSFKLNSFNYSVAVTRTASLPVTIYYNSNAALMLANAIEQNLPTNYSVTKELRAFTDTAIRIYYFTDSTASIAGSMATIVAEVSRRTVRHQIGDSTGFGGNVPALAMYITAPQTCNPLAIDALPQSLNEIWVGGTSRRFININLPGQLIYYSKDNAKTFVKYRIDEVCVTAGGAYKIIASDNDKLFKVFFFKTVKPRSFDLSECEGLAKTKGELQDKDESNCDRFNTMSWYYESNAQRIYLPVNGANLASGEKQKLDRKTDSLAKISSIEKYSIQLFRSGYSADVSDNKIRQYLTASNFSFAVSRNNSLLYFTKSDIPANQNPFMRSYLVVNLEINPVVEKGGEVKQEITPNCDITFTSLDEIKRQASPLIVCKLDLSKAGLTTIPNELSSFTNMKQLFLGSTSIPQTEIDQLQKQLPNCEIIYQPINTGVNPGTNTPATGTLICNVTALNIRRAPSFSAQVTGVLKAGAIIQYIEVVNGESANGNSLWFKTVDGTYLWGGGVSIYSRTGKKILWVDDHPENNEKLIQNFKNEGISTVTAVSNSQAASLLSKERDFNLVISDIGRDKEGETAGLGMSDVLKKNNVNVPLIFYTSNDQVKTNADNAYKLRADLVTNNSSELTSRVNELLNINTQKKK
jgi:CheY-like chemotaxis protein